MPWCAAARPNLSAGLVKALAVQAGAQCSVIDGSLSLAVRLGPALYEAYAETSELFGALEHVFATDLFGTEPLDSDAFLEPYRLSDGAHPLAALRDEVVPGFLSEMTKEVLAAEPDVVGFTCTFNQVFASLALARRLKALRPALRILLGGACVHGAMGEEYARCFPELVDHVFLGEADVSFPCFIERVACGQPVHDISGLTVEGRATGASSPVHNLDVLPAPDFDDYFAARARLEAAGARLQPVAALPFESSRGCWWGAKQHCTFCGLNNLGMAFRAKSPSRVVQEVEALVARYGVARLMAADNIITHRDYRALLEGLQGLGLDLRLFYEVKANLGRDDIALLADAGVRWIQPGIEAFSDHLLQLMRKGITALQNVQLLRLCAEFGVAPSYNLLFGFPGETAADYEETARFLARLRHLTPPSGPPSLVQIHRFSPFHQDPSRFGFGTPRPAAYYRHLVPPGRAQYKEIAYFFDRDCDPADLYHAFAPSIATLVEDWRSRPRRLVARLMAGRIEIEAAEMGESPDIRSLDRAQAAALLAADRICGIRQAVMAAQEAEANDPEATVRAMIDDGLIMQQGERLVSMVPFERPKRAAELARWRDRWLSRPVAARPTLLGTY
jgi:ribosomal peptide maturation radical SAM protein 1